MIVKLRHVATRIAVQSKARVKKTHPFPRVPFVASNAARSNHNAAFAAPMVLRYCLNDFGFSQIQLRLWFMIWYNMVHNIVVVKVSTVPA